MLSLDFGPKGIKPFCTPEEWEQARHWVEASDLDQMKRLWSRMLCADVPLLMMELNLASAGATPWESLFFAALLSHIPLDATELKVNRP